MERKNWFDGKKTIIAAVVSLTAGFLQAKGLIDGEWATYILSLSTLLLGVGVTHKVIKKEI